MHTTVPLSQLTASRRNPRRVKPEREAHRRLVASIRTHGLLEPLIVQPVDSGGGDDSGGGSGNRTFRVIAGNRRLAALREVYRGQEAEVSCEVRDVDRDTADALSLTENFAREGMHPLDEAEAFAKLASVECKGVAAIAAEFGVTVRYVRQRMKLATLAQPVKAAYREGDIDTAVAEAFAAVPEDRQLEVWEEIGANVRDARHVRAVIENGWIDAEHALFNVNDLPDKAISRDLFSERVLVERGAFMDAQGDALIAERESLIEDGWGEVVIAARADVHDRLYAMDRVEGVVDEQTADQLAAIDRQRTKLEAELYGLDEDDETGLDALYEQLDELDRQQETLENNAPRHHLEAIKALATVFLLLDSDGRVRREERMPRQARTVTANGNVGSGSDGQTPLPPTSDDLSDRQKATTYTHQALGVRAALLKDRKARKRVMALLLHEKLRTGGLTVRHDANATDLHADNSEGFASSVGETLRRRRAELDPFENDHALDATEAYQRLADMPDAQLDALIDVLTVQAVTASLHRPTELVALLARDLNVDVRRDWRPDTDWLNSFKKVQLAHLIGELRGPAHEGPALNRKKSQLVEELAKLFTDAAKGRLEDGQLAQRVNKWLPATLREDKSEAAETTQEPSQVAA